MSAKILPSLTDENRDLQKQIGCMNGIFQFFDRHYFLTGRRSTGHHHKRLLPGANNSREANNAKQKGKELKVVQDQPRVSTESLGTSFSSSSCSSTFSSVDHSKTFQCRPPSFNQSNFLESPNEIPVKQQNSSLHFSQQSPDLRDVVKDSMQRERRQISVKTAVREEGRGRTLKHIDSPRPFQQTVQPGVAELDRPNRIFVKLQESPWNCKVEKDAPLRQVQKEPPRFSYDERETRDTLKSTTKLKELPRLSLDSRQSSLRGSAFESRLNFLGRELQRENGTASQIVNANQEPGSNKRPPSVVVKLMGLEDFPDSVSNDEGETMKVNSCNRDFFTKLSKKSEKNKKNPALFQQTVHKDPASPASKNASLGTKPTSSPRFPLETGPWRQPDAINDSPRITPGSWNSCRNIPQISSSVYGEIEKRISEIEFRKSGKDLRALKEILEAMQNTRRRLDNQEGEQADLKSETSRYSSDYSCSDDQGSKASKKWQSNKSDHLASPKVTCSPKRFTSSILITKPSRSMDDSRISSTSVALIDASHLPKLRTRDILCTRRDSVGKPAAKDLTPRKSTAQNLNHCNHLTDKKINQKLVKVVQTRRASQLVKVENYTTFGRSSGTVSPRFQQKSHGIEKQPHLTTTSPDLGKKRRKLTESVSLNSKLRPKSTPHLHKDKISSISDSKNFSHQSDSASIQSESNSSLASLAETEVTSIESSTEIKARQQVHQKERNGAAKLDEDMPLAELMIVPTEQPSPVSVLDATFYREGSPSPVKKISTVFQDYGTPNLDEAEWDLGDAFNQKKSENIKHLSNKLRLLNTIPDEASMFEFASLSKRPSPDHKYITKMLLASGLLQDIHPVSTAIQLHSSGHLINPDLFNVLEQTEQNTMPANEESKQTIAPLKFDQKIHRKIIFDTVDEILVRQLASESTFMQRKRTRTRQELLRELYLEVDRLQAKADCSLDDAVTQQPDDWADYQSEIPAMVLDIERLIFKDLITEVITAEAVG